MNLVLNKFEICDKIPQIIKNNVKSFYVFNDSKTEKKNLILITNEDRAYGLGENSFGVLGLGHNKPVEVCTEINVLKNQKINRIFNGKDFVIGLNEKNDIFCWGRNCFGQLGNGYQGYRQRYYKPSNLTRLSNDSIKDVSCGTHHTLLLFSNGDLFGWGKNNDYQLGFGFTKVISIPQRLMSEKIKYIFSYGTTSFAISEEGFLFDNRHGSWSSHKVENVEKISSDGKNIYILTEDGCIYRFGKDKCTPELIEMTNLCIVDISVNVFNVTYMYCVDSNNTYYAIFDGVAQPINDRYDSLMTLYMHKNGVTQILQIVSNQEVKVETKSRRELLNAKAKGISETLSRIKEFDEKSGILSKNVSTSYKVFQNPIIEKPLPQCAETSEHGQIRNEEEEIWYSTKECISKKTVEKIDSEKCDMQINQAILLNRPNDSGIKVESIINSKRLHEDKAIDNEEVERQKRFSTISLEDLRESFTFQCEIDKGGFGNVSKYLNNLDQQFYAIKEISLPDNDEEKKNSMLQEVRTMAKLKGDYVVQYNNSWIENIYLCIQMEFCFDNLRNVLKIKPQVFDRSRNQAMNALEYFISCEILRQITKGLNYLHSLKPKPLIHRDLKPENILIGMSGDKRICKLADFGLSKFTVDQPEYHTRGVGTQRYRAPEITENGKDNRCKYTTKVDIYSLGIICLELFNICNHEVRKMYENSGFCDKFEKCVETVNKLSSAISLNRLSAQELLQVIKELNIDRDVIESDAQFDYYKNKCHENDFLFFFDILSS